MRQKSVDSTVEVSVIIPSYNMADYLPDAVRSVIEGEFRPLEVIVVDDGSTDETGEVIQQFVDPDGSSYDERVRYVYQENQGKSEAVNCALEIARGEYVSILDADDVLPPASVSRRYAEAADRNNENVDLVIGGFEVFLDDETFGRRLPPQTSDADHLKNRFSLGLKTPFSLNGCLISRKLIRRVGTFDARLKRCMDIDYAMRLLDEACSQRMHGVVVSLELLYRRHCGVELQGDEEQ